ncbi:MAG: acyl-CoA thioesterase [Oscillospiraceae bacterium]|jgi:acyl-CoA thioester hydrolase
MQNEAVPYIRRAFFYETDMMGIIHHANYILWMEEARTDFMEKAGLGKLEGIGIQLPVVSLSCRYVSSVRSGDIIEVGTLLAFFNGIRAIYKYEMRDAGSGRLVAAGETVHCFLDERTGMPVNLKKRCPELYERAFKACKLKDASEIT